MCRQLFNLVVATALTLHEKRCTYSSHRKKVQVCLFVLESYSMIYVINKAEAVKVCSCPAPLPYSHKPDKKRSPRAIEKQTKFDPAGIFSSIVLSYISRKGLCRVKPSTTPLICKRYLQFQDGGVSNEGVLSLFV